MDSTWKMKLVLVIIIFLCIFDVAHGGLEPGIFKFNVTDNEKLMGITKSLSNKTNVIFTVKCLQEDSSPSCLINLEWVLRFSDCDNAFMDVQNYTSFFSHPESSMLTNEEIMRYQKSNPGNETETCDHKIMFQDQTYLASINCYTIVKDVKHCTYIGPKETSKPEDKETDKKGNENEAKETPKKDTKARRKREKQGDETPPKPDDTGKQGDETPPKPDDTGKQGDETPPKPDVTGKQGDETPPKPDDTGKQGDETPPKPDDTGKQGDETPPKPDDTGNSKDDKNKEQEQSKAEPTKPSYLNRITQTWQDGRYLFVFKITSNCESPNMEVTVEFQNEKGYLSVTQRPLLTFYAVMCAAYTILAFIWLLMMACQWRDILRIQFWICGVVILGLLEKVVFYSEYHHMNTTGESSPATLVFAELVSCLKRTVARMLVIIVSMGFGITKPRLGPQLHRVIGVGFLFFVLSSIEACLRVQGNVQQQLVSSIPLAVLDAVICYWIFTNLVDTTRTLRLRRNVVKLWLYRHFTNSLIFCVIAAVIFLTWSTKEHKLAVCVTRWKELWLDDAYWHILFYIVLVVIIILWRPTANNQRYAYSPLTDALEDDESKEPMIPESFEGMKMRNVNKTESAPTKVEDDLKWVEENIPASVADVALAVFDDSDEEIVTNIERSKME